MKSLRVKKGCACAPTILTNGFKAAGITDTLGIAVDLNNENSESESDDENENEELQHAVFRTIRHLFQVKSSCPCYNNVLHVFFYQRRQSQCMYISD